MRKVTRAKLLMSSPLLPSNKQCTVKQGLGFKLHLQLEISAKNLEEVKTGQLESFLVKVRILLFFHLRQINVEEISWLVRVSADFVLQNTFPTLKM